MTQRKPHILIVDDDHEIGQLLSDFLQQFHYQVTHAKNAHEMKKALQAHIFDICLLDIMLPETDGFTLCKNLREQSNIPIIIISALNNDNDRILGLEIGADDYVPKPFNTRELLARIKSLLRRSNGGELTTNNKVISQIPIIQFDQWKLDRNTNTLISKDNLSIPLSTKEFQLLMIFLEYPQRILTRDQLTDMLYDKEADLFDRTIDVLIGRLRKKIEDNPKKPQLLLTVRGSGYQLTAEIRDEK